MSIGFRDFLMYLFFGCRLRTGSPRARFSVCRFHCRSCHLISLRKQLPIGVRSTPCPKCKWANKIIPRDGHRGIFLYLSKIFSGRTPKNFWNDPLTLVSWRAMRKTWATAYGGKSNIWHFPTITTDLEETRGTVGRRQR